MVDINTWAARWGIPQAALDELRGLGADPGTSSTGESEAAVQARVRIAASRAGWRLWRNNVGVLPQPETGVPIRFGLANDSAQLNKVLKSGDLIGIRPVLIGPQHLGSTIGQFISLECKHSGWKYAGTDRERAQEAWAALVTSLGGVGRFISDPSAL